VPATASPLGWFDVMRMMTFIRKIRMPYVVLWVILLALPASCFSATTLDDLKKLDILCFVPSYLPEGFRLKSVEITYDEIQEYEDKNHPLPLYSLVYGNGPSRTGSSGAKFWVDSAREGIGDRNIMEEEDAEETEIQSPLGRMYLIYRPKGKAGRKIEIDANWLSDANMDAEKSKDQLAHPVLGRYHGFSASGITLAEFTKIISSLHPIKSDPVNGPKPPPAAASTASLKIHPKVFDLIDCWISDSESPVVTEINLDAVEKDGNEFNDDGLKQEGEWTRAPAQEANGFMRYRLLESKGNRYKVEYQENGGGTLTTASIIEFTIEKREIRRDNKPVIIRVLRVLSYALKAG
jgi:hypothetical protein